MRVESLMTTPAFACHANDSLSVAARMMWDRDCGALPVTNDENEVVGIITDRDICMGVYTQGKSPQAIRVYDVMAKQVYCCHPHDPIDVAETLMSKHQVRRIPVVDGGRHLLGILSVADLVRAARTLRHRSFEHDAARTLSAISAPRRSSTVGARMEPLGLWTSSARAS